MSTAQQNEAETQGRMVGRFEMFDAFASGGFAAIHLGRTVSAGGFSKRVAIKRLHSAFVEDAEVRTMFLDEARVVARIQHPNVVPTMDFIADSGELFMVMEYVEGITLGELLHDVRTVKKRIPLDVVARIITGTLSGLHAAHQAKDEQGNALGVIHRDVSPENILVGTDGFARILDFGVARAMGRYHATQAGHVKGTIAYMTPEQVMGVKELTPRSDVFAASAVMWECITNRTLFDGDNPGELALQVAQQQIVPPNTYVNDLSTTVNQVVMRGLERDPAQRWETAEQMAEAIEAVTKVASDVRLGKWLRRAANKRLAARAEKVAVIEADVRGDTGSAQSSEGESAYKASVTQVLRMKPAKGQKPGEATEKVTIAERHLGEATASGPGAPASHRGGPPPVSQGGAPPVSGPGVAAASHPGPVAAASGPGQAPPVSQPGLEGPTSQPGAPAPAASDPGLAAPISQPGLVPDSSSNIDVDLMEILDPATPSPTSTPGGAAQPSDPGAAPPAEPSTPDQLVMLDAGGSSANSDTIAPPEASSRKGAYGVGAAVAALAAVVVAAVVSFGSSSDEQGQPAPPVGESAPGSPAAMATGEAPSSPPQETQAEPEPPAEPAEPDPPEPAATAASPPGTVPPEPVAVGPPQGTPPEPTAAAPPEPGPPPATKPAAPPPKPWRPPPKKPKGEDDLFGRK